ncbi:MAG TPA: hypothetical protein VK866_04775 [Acidimicrobiales bacterium]|nr:hypothetical protein [Acidimicrobiales bacterium]
MTPARSIVRRSIDWWFRDRTSGELVVAQAPNAPILVFIAAWAVRRIADPEGALDRVLDITGTVALVVWALDEVVRGVNPWRRLLGTVVLVGLVITRR